MDYLTIKFSLFKTLNFKLGRRQDGDIIESK